MKKSRQIQKFRTTRWMQLIFPQELIIDEAHVLTRKRHFPAFWIIKEESIPLSKIASIQITRGLLFSLVVIENSGGPFPITIKGIPNRKALLIRRTLESHDLSQKDNEIPENEKSTKTDDGEKKIRGLLSFISKAKKRDESIDFEDEEPIEAWWKDSEDSMPDTVSEEQSQNEMQPSWMNDLVKQPSKSEVSDDDW